MGSRFVIYLDAYHASDNIFVNDLGRSLLAWPAQSKSGIIVRNPADSLERLFEGRGLAYPDDSHNADHELDSEVTRVLRESNRRLVAQLTDIGVAAVGLLGSDRDTIAVDQSGELAVRSQWLWSIARPGVFPVLEPTASAGGNDKVVSIGEVLAALTHDDTVDLIAFPRGIAFSASSGLEFPSGSSFERDILSDFDEIRQIRESQSLFLTHPKCLKSAEMDGKWTSGVK